MPIYEYHCGACGHEHEALQKIADAPLRKCPECGKRALRRVLSAVSFRLKGGGWYETDFKSDSEKKRNLVEAAGKESGDAPAAPEAAASKDASKEGTGAASAAGAAGGSPTGDNKPTKPAEPEKNEPARKSVAVKAGAASAKKPATVRRRRTARA